MGLQDLMIPKFEQMSIDDHVFLEFLCELIIFYEFRRGILRRRLLVTISIFAISSSLVCLKMGKSEGI